MEVRARVVVEAGRWVEGKVQAVVAAAEAAAAAGELEAVGKALVAAEVAVRETMAWAGRRVAAAVLAVHRQEPWEARMVVVVTEVVTG